MPGVTTCTVLCGEAELTHLTDAKALQYRMGGRQMAELDNWDVALQMVEEPSQNFDISWFLSCVAETSGIYALRKPQSD